MSFVRLRLCAMMFLQYFTWGAWGVSIGGYMGETLKFSGTDIGAVYSTTAIGAMISPLFLGYVADRLFATERILGVLHLLGGGLLWYAASQTAPGPLYYTMLVYALCYMPTLALTNSISFENIGDPEKEFPLIRVFGTLGWIVAGWIVGLGARIGLPIDGVTAQPIQLAALSSLALGVLCFALPHTPPKGNQGPTEEVEGRLNISTLLKQPSFLIFVIASFLICIPLAFYYNLANLFLVQIDAPSPTALQTLGQISEVFFMAAMPWFIMRLGVKRMLAVGMLAWVLRYFLFGSLALPLVVVGILLHGICYDFFFVASQIYVDNKASVAQRARAQSFIAFVTLGLGMFVGAYVAGFTFDRYPPPLQVAVSDAEGQPIYDEQGEPVTVPLPDWDRQGEAGIAAEMNLTAESQLDPEQLPQSLPLAEDRTLTRPSLEATLRQVDEEFGDGDGQISRPEWRKAQQAQWFYIWLWPGIGAGATLVLFWFGFRDEPRGVAREMAEESPLGPGEGHEPQVG